MRSITILGDVMNWLKGVWEHLMYAFEGGLEDDDEEDEEVVGGYYLIITSQEVGCCDRTYLDTHRVFAKDVDTACRMVVKRGEMVEAIYFCGTNIPYEVEVI